MHRILSRRAPLACFVAIAVVALLVRAEDSKEAATAKDAAAAKDATEVETAQTKETTAAAPQDQGEFSAHGSGIVRVELEAKLKVPLEQTEPAWQWLQERFSDCSWLDRDGHKFSANFGDEDFVDVYFDTPDLKLLAGQSGVRHRSRVVHSGSAARKDGRQLLQIKLNRGDASGLGRSEIKFTVTPSTVRSNTLDESHPMLGLVAKDELEACKKQFQELDLDPYSMLPVVTIKQNRRRVYVSDQWGAFVTVTLDLCTCNSWGADLRWTEIELELNEIRYTEASEEQRREMEKYVGVLQAEVQGQFPDIEQDQTPKYNKAFAAVEQGAWAPIRQVIAKQIDETQFRNGIQFGILGVAGLIVCAGLWIFRGRWMSRPESVREPAVQTAKPAAITTS